MKDVFNTLEMAKSQRSLQLGICPECRSNRLVTDMNSGEVICSTCGMVVKDLMLDLKPEWRAFTAEEKEARRRVGPPITHLKYDKGLSTSFLPHENASGGTLSAKTRFKMRRLRRWNIRTQMHTSVARNLSQAMAELNRLTDALHIPKAVQAEAAHIYRKTLNEGLVRGRSILSIAAASLYAACRLTKTPRSLKDIVDASTRNRKEVARCYRLIQRYLDMRMPIDDSVIYVPKIASKVGLDQKIQNQAIEILQEAKAKGTTMGKGPLGMAAAALYLAVRLLGGNVTQRELASAAEVTEVTVRNRYKRMVKDLGLKLTHAASYRKQQSRPPESQ